MTDYREIALTQGMVALVDEEDYERVSQYKWCACYHPNPGGGGVFRAVCNYTQEGKARSRLLHRFVLNAPSGVEVDHVDRGRSLDCRRYNLRLATHSQNLANQRKTLRPTSSRYKGVTRVSARNRWRAQLKTRGRNNYLGDFTHEDDAARAYNAAATIHFGQFALLNVVPPAG